MRTDNDSWDISSSVGATALLVAAARALEARKTDPLAVDPFAEQFSRAAGGDWDLLMDDKLPDHRLASADFGRHFINYQGARTKYFDAFFARAAAAGVRQVVLLAAGLDARAYRLDWPAGTVVYELDQPQVLQFKREFLQAHGAAATASRVEVPVDLRHDWPAALRAAGFDAEKPAAFLAEGLLIYLPGDAQGQLFQAVNELAAPGSHVAVEEGTPIPDEAFQQLRAEALASGEPEPWFMLIYNQMFAPAAEWFGERGWTATATPLADLLREYGRPTPDAETEPEAERMIASNTLVSAVKTI